MVQHWNGKTDKMFGKKNEDEYPYGILKSC